MDTATRLDPRSATVEHVAELKAEADVLAARIAEQLKLAIGADIQRYDAIRRALLEITFASAGRYPIPEVGQLAGRARRELDRTLNVLLEPIGKMLKP